MEMAKVDTEILPNLLEHLAAQLGSERFELWFGNSVRLQCIDDVLRVESPTAFHRDWLRQHFRREIDAACRKCVGPSAAIEFTIADRKPRAEAGASDALPQQSASGDEQCTNAPADDRAKSERGPSSTEPVSPRPARPDRRQADFADFVVGQGNRLAYTSARTAVEQPGRVSPLMIYGDTGVGKTHLLEAIRRAARLRYQRSRIVYLTAEQFTSLFVEALRGGGLPSFRRKYRGVDLLLIDDVHFFAGKKATLLELLHTVDNLQRESRQVVLTSDRPLAQIKDMEPELAARLAAGLTCQIDPPDFDVRRGIVQRLCLTLDVPIPDDVQALVASQITGSARELAGALHRLQAVSVAHATPVTREMAEPALSDLVVREDRRIGLPQIEQAVCQVFGVSSENLRSPRRHRAVSHPRMLAMWLARKHTRAALSEIGTFFGGRSHTTVLSAGKKVEHWMSQRASVAVDHASCNVEEAIRRIERTMDIA